MNPTTTQRFAAFLVFASALACIAIPLEQLLGPGPFLWHVHRPAYWQGGLEALALLAILVVAAAALRRLPAVAIVAAIALALYLRRHAVDVPLLLDLAMVEIAIGLGAFVLRRLRMPAPADARGYLQAFVLGFLAWSLAIWIASAVGAGSIPALRILTALVAIPALFGGHAPLTLHLWRSLRAAALPQRMWGGALLAWIAILFARADVVLGYDSLWYGFRSEYVLAPGHSLFEPLGLVSPVFHFPKLYEAFLLPLSRLGDTSVLSGMTILVMALCLLACLPLMQRIEVPQRLRLPLLALVATLPALANSSVTPKPDVLSLLFLLVAADAAFGTVRNRSVADGLWLCACLVLACLAKLTAIPYAGALLLTTTAAVALTPAPKSPSTDVDRRAAGLAGAAALLVAVLVTARTAYIAGVPTIGPDALVKLWNALGLQLAEPTGTLDWTRPQVWSDVPALVLDWLFRPQRLPHVITTWVGNVWFWFGALALVAAGFGLRLKRRDAPRAGPLVVLAVVGALLAVTIRYHERGSDGNYFLAALLPAILLGGGALFRRLEPWPHVLAAALACLPAFAGFQAAVSFLTGGWQPGTRAWDVDFSRNWKDKEAQRAAALDKAGLTRIATHLRAADGAARAVGYVQAKPGFWLPARFESLLDISYSRREYLADEAAFLAFLRAQRIDALILPQPHNPVDAEWIAPAVPRAFAQLAASPLVRRVEDRDYVLLDLSAWRADGAGPATTAH